MNPVLLATFVAAVVGGTHWISHRFLGDEVSNSKRVVSKTAILVTGVTWFLVYFMASSIAIIPAFTDLVTLPIIAFIEALIRLFGAVINGLGQLVDALLGGVP
jgi:hypothetical protein